MQLLVLFLSSLLFLAIKAANNDIRLSDSNIYFYTASQLLKGHALYKDIFFTNFPLFPVISSLYVFFLQRLELYYLTALIEVLIAAFLIFYIVKEKTKNANISLLSSLLYLFSFIILTTSDHQSGVFLATLFSLLGYLFFLKKRFFICGIFLACCLMTKAYFLPVTLAFLIVMFIDDYKNAWKVLLAYLLVSFIILFPFILTARNDLVKDIISYSLVRLQGISKFNMLYFFSKHDFILVLLFVFSLINIKNNKLLFFICSFSLIFIIFYQDIYYLYLNLLVPYLCISISDFFTWFKKYQKKYAYYIVLGAAIVMSSVNVWFYIHTYSKIGQIQNIGLLRSIINREKPDYLYGDNDITPALAYLTNIPLLNSSIDTNPNIFRKGFLNATTLTNKAIQTRTIIVTQGAQYPLANVDEKIIGEIYDSKIIEKNCIYLDGTNTIAEGIENRINLFKCY